MVYSLPKSNDRRREAVVAYGWASPAVGLSTTTQLERIRRHCEAQGWVVASEVIPRRFPDLVELARRASEPNVRRVVLTRDVLSELERRYPEVWGDIRARLATRAVAIEAC